MNTQSRRKLEEITNSHEEWLIESLRDKRKATTYLQVAFEEFQKDGDIKALLLALRHVAEAQGGLSLIARKARLNRESLCKTLSKNGNPKIQTIGTLLKALGFQFSIKCA